MESLVEKLAGYVSKQENIMTAWLFGSQVTGITHTESDVDLALLFQRTKVPSADRLLQIQDDLTSLLHRETDIVVLNDASPHYPDAGFG